MNSVGISERLSKLPALFEAAKQATSVGIRVAMPGYITKVNDNQTVVVQLTITENVNMNTGSKIATKIPPIPDVILMVPSDTNFSITFPDLLGAEVLVVFADMCVNGWWNLSPLNGSTIANQERIRRHSLSDGFAILAPKSKNNAIPNWSNVYAEFKANNGNAKVSLDNNGNLILTGATSLQLDTPLLEWNNAPTPNVLVSPTSYNNITNSIPIKINGVTYYIKLSTSP